MDKKISQLNESLNIENSDFLPIVNGGQTKKATKQNFLKEVNESLDEKADLVGGLVPSSQLPPAVDEILEYATLSGFPETGESNKYYLALDTNKTYRWSGSLYTAINEGIALGETSSTAYRGDRGKTAYDHSQEIGNPHGTTPEDLGLEDLVGNNIVNYTIDDYTNTVHADATHLRVKATEDLLRGDVLKFVGFNFGEQAIEVAKRDTFSEPAIAMLHEDLLSGELGMAISNGLFKNIDTSGYSEGSILYPDDTGSFTTTATVGNDYYNQPFAYIVRSHAVNGEIMLNIGQSHDQAEQVSVSNNTDRGYTPTDESVEGHLEGIRDKLETIENIILQPYDYWQSQRFQHTNIVQGIWIGGAISSGSISTAIPTDSLDGINEHGVFIRSSTTANGGFRFDTASKIADYFGVRSHKFTCKYKPRTDFTGRIVRAGYLDTITFADSVDGAYFEIDGSGNAFGKTANNSTRSSTPTYALTLNTAYSFEIDAPVDLTGGIRFRIFIDGDPTPVFDEVLIDNIPQTTARTFGSGFVATESSTTTSDIGILYEMGVGTIDAYRKNTGRN